MRIQGIIPPVATPMQDNEDLDLPRLRSFIDHLLAAGVHGIFVLGTNSEFYAMDEDEKQRVAYHEAGHALVACALPNTDPVHKISIIPRGVGALGYVLQRPEDDRHLYTKSELESKIKVALGGTMAEELIYREISNGATSDLDSASQIARRMVKELGGSAYVVATGGQAALVAGLTHVIEKTDPLLTVEGLRLIYLQNADGR